MVKEIAYIIDEDGVFIERVKKLLGEDYIVTVFGSPEAAADEILKKKPDVVITELVFSSLDGINFIASLKEKCVESPIVIATKLHPSLKIAEIFRIAGCFNKGISDDELYQKIKKASGWKRKKVAPPPLPIITEGKIGEAVKVMLDDVCERKKKECLEKIGALDYSRALEIAGFLRRMYPTDLRTHGLLREIIMEKKAANPEEEQTSFTPDGEVIGNILNEARAAHENKNINKILECAKELFLLEDIANGIRISREIVVFSEENPFLVEQVIIQKEKIKVPVWDVMCAGCVFLSFFIQPYIFAALGVAAGIASVFLAKEKKLASFAIPAAVIIVILNLVHFPLMSDRISKWRAEMVSKKNLQVSPRYFRPGRDVLTIKYNVLKPSRVVITASSNRQSAQIVNNPEHKAGTFEIQWNGKTKDNTFIRNDFRLSLDVGGKHFTERVYIGN